MAGRGRQPGTDDDERPRDESGHRLGYEMSQMRVAEALNTPAERHPGRSHRQEIDDEAVAKALQAEYDRENSDMRQHASSQPLPDYRAAGYIDTNAQTMPSVVPACCTMCQGVTPVPYAPGRLQFRCDRCGFLNTCTIPRGRPAFGDRRYCDDSYMPLICCVQ